MTERPPTGRGHRAPGGQARPRARTRQGPVEKPFLFLGSALDSCELANRLTDYAVLTHGPAHPLSFPVRDFCNQLMFLYQELERCWEGKRLCEQNDPSDELRNSKHIFESYIDRGEDFYHRAQELITMCEGAMPGNPRRGDGSIRKTASDRFIGALIGHDQQLHRTETLSNDMRNWVQQSRDNCTPLLARLKRKLGLSESDED